MCRITFQTCASRENCVGIYGCSLGHIYMDIHGCSLGHIYIHGSIWMLIRAHIEYLFSPFSSCAYTYGCPWAHIYTKALRDYRKFISVHYSVTATPLVNRYLLACTLMCTRASLLDLPAGATTVDFFSC